MKSEKLQDAIGEVKDAFILDADTGDELSSRREDGHQPETQDDEMVEEKQTSKAGQIIEVILVIAAVMAILIPIVSLPSGKIFHVPSVETYSDNPFAGNNPEPSFEETSPDTLSSLEYAEETEPETLNETEENTNNPLPVQLLGGSEASFGFPGEKQHPQNNGMDYEPSIFLRQDLDVLPDPLHTAGGLGDSLEDGVLHIGALDMDLPIPEGYYVYRIPGEYLDVYNDRNVTLSFVDEYIFTVREVEQEKLLEDIRLYLSRTHNSNDAAYRGPGYVVWDFRVFHKKYLPIENLFISAIADTGEYFEKGDYYISMGRRLWWGPSTDNRDPDGGTYVHVFYDAGEIYDVSKLPGYSEPDRLQKSIDAGVVVYGETWPVEAWISGMIEETNDHGLITESHDNSPITTGGSMPADPLFYYAKSMFACGPSACFMKDTLIDGREYTWWVANPDASPISAKWQEDYKYALAELEEHPENYEYPEVRYSFEIWNYTRDTRWWVSYDKDMLRKGWIIDQEKDRIFRAAVYADLKAWYDETDLDRIMILLKDTGEGFLFGAYLLDEEAPYTMSALMYSWDAADGMDLDFLLKYGESYLLQAEEEKDLFGSRLKVIYEEDWEKENSHSYIDYNPYTKLASTTVYPDELGSAFKGEKDTQNGTSYHIYPLDVDIHLPEGCYVTVIPGLFLDREGKEVVLEFVDEYVLTSRPYTIDELISCMRNVKVRREDDEERFDPILYFKGEIPEDILLSFYVFRKEYYPLSGLFVAETGGVFGGKRTGGNYYYEIIYDRGETSEITNTLKELYAGDPHIRYAEYDPFWSQYSLILTVNHNTLLSSTATLLDQMHLRFGTTFHLKNPDCSVANPVWMRAYENACQELELYPEKYHHEIGLIEFVREPKMLGPNENELKEYEETLLTGWYSDETSDQKLKAMIYANLIGKGEDIALEDIVIVFHQTEGDRAFIAFAVDRTSQTLVVRDKGIDGLDEVDFTFAYRYAGKYLSGNTEK